MKYRVILFSLILFSSVSAQQKWTVISKFPVSGYYTYPVPYFFNEQYGFVLLQISGINETYRTIDGGKTWKQVYPNIDENGQSGYYTIDNLSFDTPSHLYASSSNFNYLVESNDSGLTWKYRATYYNTYGSSRFYPLNGILYSFDGYYSTDDGKSWTLDYHPFWGGAQAVIGNKENGIACLGGSKGNTLFTTDAGYSWNTTKINNSFYIGYAIPYTLTYFGVNSHLWLGQPEDSLMRSLDGGMSWVKVYPNKSGTKKLSGEITGSGEILFDLGESGVVRSTDLGSTWDSISNLKRALSTHLSAVARGAICFAADDTGRLWKFVDSSLLRSATWDLSIQHSSATISHDTLFARTCDSARLIINYGFRGSDYIKLDDIIVDGISRGEYRADFVKDKVIMTGRDDTAGITFTPDLPGTYPITIHSSILRDDWVREDTTFRLTLVVKPNAPVLSLIANKRIDFGAQILCSAKTVTDSFSVKNIGCDSLQIQSVVLEVDQNPKSDFTFAQVHSFGMFREDAERKFFISYRPSAVGVATGRIIITTNAGIDTISVTGEGLRDRHALSFGPDTLRAKVGDVATGYLQVLNLGCRLMDLDSVQTQAPLIFPSGEFYFPLGVSENEDIKVIFTPQKIGLATFPVHAFLRVLSESDTVSFDTTLSVTIEGLNGTGSAVLPDHEVISGKDILILSLHPNPAQEEIEVILQSETPESARIEILNTLGAIVYSDVRNLIPGQNTLSLSIHDLSEGTYFLRIITSKGVSSGSFMRIR